MNAMLREQLEQAGVANEALSQDIRRLTADWTKAREELEQKESDWRREAEVWGGRFRDIRRKTKRILRVISAPCFLAVFPQLLQQRAQSAADALASSRRLPEERLRTEERH